jgi:hypothetical protein
MPTQRSAAVDWEPYKADITEFYVKQDNTAADTIAYLQNKYDLHVGRRTDEEVTNRLAA